MASSSPCLLAKPREASVFSSSRQHVFFHPQIRVHIKSKTFLNITGSMQSNSFPGMRLQQETISTFEKLIDPALENCLTSTEVDKLVEGLRPLGKGKVRDLYESKNSLVIVTTDRQSAFDRVLASVPFKGQVLNQTSEWWFGKTSHIVPNAVISFPDPNVTVFKKCEIFPVEFVVRGYITGTTSTSLWTVYNKGIRNYCGNELKEGLRKNDKLEKNLLTPTTKSKDGDAPVSPSEIIERGLMSKFDFEKVKNFALQLFEFGQKESLSRNLLLVDTKYEFGKDENGNIVLVDEIHTPDSSRYWISSTYEEKHKNNIEPDNIDKEFLRIWFKNNCDPYNDKILPLAPKELITELSKRYIMLFESITGESFVFPSMQKDVHERISENILHELKRLHL